MLNIMVNEKWFGWLVDESINRCISEWMKIYGMNFRRFGVLKEEDKFFKISNECKD